MARTPKPKPDQQLTLRVPRVFKPDYSMSGSQSFTLDLLLSKDHTVIGLPSGDYGEWHEMHDLAFHCQATPGMCDDKPYGYSCEYRGVHSVGYGKAQTMLAILKRVDKIVNNPPVRPTTFGQFAQLVAVAIGVTRACQARKESSTLHADAEYIFWKASDIQWLVDQAVDDFLSTHKDAMAMDGERWKL